MLDFNVIDGSGELGMNFGILFEALDALCIAEVNLVVFSISKIPDIF